MDDPFEVGFPGSSGVPAPAFLETCRVSPVGSVPRRVRRLLRAGPGKSGRDERKTTSEARASLFVSRLRRVQAVGVEAEENSAVPSAGDLGPRVRGVVAAVAIGVFAGAVGALVSVLLEPLSDEVVYTQLVGAVAIAVWGAGRAGALAAIVMGYALALWTVTPPTMSFEASSRDDLVRWAASLAVSAVIVFVTFGMRRGHERAARAAEREELSRLRVEGLQELAAALSAALTVEEVAGVMVNGAHTVIGSRGGALGLVDAGDLVIVDPRGAVGQTLRPGSRLPLTTSAPITTAARDGKPVWVQQRRAFVEQFADGAALAPYASAALAVPVFVGGQLAGAMGFPFAEPGVVTAEVRAVARIAADLGGQALERAGLYEQERSSREALDRILAVAPRFQRGATPEAVVVSVCAEARRVFGCDVVQVWSPVDGDQIEVMWRDPPSDVIPAGTRIDYADFPGLIDHMRALKPMYVPNAQEHTRGEALRHARRLGLFSSLRVPIVIGAEFERILALQWERIMPEPAPSVMAVMRRFVDQAGLAIEQAERRRAQEDTRALQAVTEALAVATTPADVGSAIVKQGVAALGARGALVCTVTEDGDAIALLASEGYSGELTRAWERIPMDAPTPITDAVRTGETVSCATSEQIAARYPSFGLGDESFVAVPLIAAGRTIGGVFVGSLDTHRYVADPGLGIALARQAAQALDRAQLFERERASAGRLRKLQAVTAALSKAVTIADVCQACLEHAADGVGASAGVVALRVPRGNGDQRTLEVVALIGGDGLEEDMPREIPEDAVAPIADCISRGRPRVSPDGWIALPLGGGALAVRQTPNASLADADLAWIRTLVSQGAQALDRAYRYETERGIAETLQRSVLPERLPSIHGIALAARYLPGTVGVEVGGDWYDVIQLEDGSVGLVVGDVVGKGVQAAATMGQLRNALRAFAFEHNDPHAVVSRLGQLVEGMIEAPFATLAYLVVDPDRRTLRYVVAGHPPPLIREPLGTTSFLANGRALPIGVDASSTFVSGTAQLDPGSTILLYTDGLVEHRNLSLDDGLALLADAAASGYDDPEELADAVIGALVGERERPDDVALLAVQFTAAAISDLRLAVPSNEEGLVSARHELRRWLAEARVDENEAADTVLAVWEACANAAEHAQIPSEQSVRLHAMIDTAGRLRVEVGDSGRWKAGDGSADRGLGLVLMRALMESVSVTQSDEGTTVVLERSVALVAHA
jgi:GAF domain-containing protein/anti-sigma regulatory factor (Ser/Thr protein kinase)